MTERQCIEVHVRRGSAPFVTLRRGEGARRATMRRAQRAQSDRQIGISRSSHVPQLHAAMQGMRVLRIFVFYDRLSTATPHCHSKKPPQLYLLAVGDLELLRCNHCTLTGQLVPRSCTAHTSLTHCSQLAPLGARLELSLHRSFLVSQPRTTNSSLRYGKKGYLGT